MKSDNAARGNAVRQLVTCMMITLVTGGCDEPVRSPATLRSRVSTIGDTVFIETLEGSRWQGTARLEEELSIGVLEGAEEYTFGDVVEIAATDSGGFYVFDRQVPVLRQYDHQGRFMRSLGRVGDGPGEYRAAIVGMAIRHDGTLLAHDAQNRRVNLYAVDGTPLDRWHINAGLFASQSLMVDSLNQTFVKILTKAEWPVPWPWPIGLLRLDRLGRVVDTMQSPVIEDEPSRDTGPLGRVKLWAQTPYETVVGINDKSSFEIRRPGEKVIRVHRQQTQRPLSGDEWTAHDSSRKLDGLEEPASRLLTTPTKKPFYREFLVGENGRVWARKYMPSIRRAVNDGDLRHPLAAFEEAVAYDVFERDGTYLGALDVPLNARLCWIGSETIFGVRTGAHGEQQVVRFRIKEPTK